VTTILSDAHLGVMVADSSVSDGDRVWSERKVFRIKGALIGLAGEDGDCGRFLQWVKDGLPGKPRFGETAALILTPGQLLFFDGNYVEPVKVKSGREAIGSGGKSAMCAYEALGWTDPRRAVRIVCRHDAASRAPVRVYMV